MLGSAAGSGLGNPTPAEVEGSSATCVRVTGDPTPTEEEEKSATCVRDAGIHTFLAGETGCA